MLKTTVKFLVSLTLALLVAWAVRTYAFTVFSVPAGGLPPQLEEGDRVIVNRTDCDSFERGETVVFSDSVARREEYFIGRVKHLPGDTLTLGRARYIIPTICCKRCGCPDCRYYLVQTASGQQLVHKHQMLGKAYKLF